MPIAVLPIGWVRSRLTDVTSAPCQADEGAPPAVLALLPEYAALLEGLRAGDRIVVLTWLHEADRSERTTHPRGDLRRPCVGVFATRSPGRPNPIGVHPTVVERIEGSSVHVTGLEAIDRTPILDIKPALEDPSGR